MVNQGILPEIVKQLSPSLEQEPAITARGSDVAVVASAGTGKTRTLVGRFLGLLAEGIPLRSIVAITFTNKAAREMRNRIREEIRTYVESIGSDHQRYEYWQDIYQNLDAARISTIHSLAAEIIRQHPAELNIDPKFELIDEGQAGRLKSQAVETSLRFAARDVNTSQLFVFFGDWKLRRLISELLGKRLEVEDAISRMGEDPWAIWQPLLIKPIKEFVDHPVVGSGLDGLASLVEKGIFQKAEEAGDLLVDDLRIVIKEWKKISSGKSASDWQAISRSLGELRSHLKQKGRAANWAPAKPRKVIKEIQIIYDDLISVGNLDLALDEKLANEILPGLAVVFNYAVLEYQASKSKNHGLDFDDLEQKVLTLLEQHEGVKKYWQSQIQALLVDEYQDTNDRQRNLVNLLNGGEKKLFIVGDGKQSIYRFRGANVAVFRQEQLRIGHQGKIIQLTESYRAHPGLIDNLNRLLEPVLGRVDDIPYIEPFAELKPGRKSDKRDLQPPFVEIHLAAGTKSEGGLYLAAEALGLRILELVQRKETSNPDNPNAFSFGDIVVLCRAASSFPAYEAAFEKLGIPYLTIAGAGFYHRPEIRDLLNTLAVFADPQDDLSLTGFLRSPVGGLSDAALVHIRDKQFESGLSDMLEAARAVAENDKFPEKEILKRALSLIDDFSSLSGRISVSEILTGFVGKTGYLAAYASVGQDRSIQNIRKLISDAQQTGIVSIAAFLEMITELRSVAIRESEAQTLAEGAVQIMSVHQAKGLEFPIVVLGDAAKRARVRGGILINERFGLVPPYQDDRVEIGENGIPELKKACSFAYLLTAEAERSMEDAESDRLLYVAATRAEDLLIINGAIGKPGQDQKIKSLAGWLGKLAEPLGLTDIEIQIQANGDSVQRFDLHKAGLAATLSIYEMGLKIEAFPGIRDQKDPTASLATWIKPQDKTIPDSIEFDRDQLKRITYRSDQAPAWMVGLVVHRALELWKFPSVGEGQFQEWSISEFKKLGLLGENELKTGYRRVVKMLERFQDSDLYRRMIQSAQIKHEIPFSDPANGMDAHIGLIDAMFQENDDWVLVEFKTDKIDTRYKKNLSEKLSKYQQQVGGYLDAAERILGERPTPILCFLNYDGRIHLETDLW